MIARLICWMYGHKRGKRVPETNNVRCPRCGAQWERPKKTKAAA